MKLEECNYHSGAGEFLIVAPFHLATIDDDMVNHVLV